MHIEYQLYLEDEVYKTDVFEGRNQNPGFNYEKLHSFKYVSQNVLEYLKSGKLTLKVFGN
jgi:hypothetical protein